MRIIRILTFSALLAGVLASCGEKKMNVPENLVGREDLVSLLVDIHLTDALLNKEKKPHAEKLEESLKLYPQVLLKHNIDRAVFDSTIRFYVKYPKEFALIYDDVLRELSIMEGEVQKEVIKTDEEY